MKLKKLLIIFLLPFLANADILNDVNSLIECANEGNYTCMFSLGCIYSSYNNTRTEGIEPNDEIALYWFNQAVLYYDSTTIDIDFINFWIDLY